VPTRAPLWYNALDTHIDRVGLRALNTWDNKTDERAADFLEPAQTAIPGVADADDGAPDAEERPPLPSGFIRRMEAQLGEEAAAFLRSYGEPRAHGLRLNGRKLADLAIGPDKLRGLFGLEPVPWCPGGFYYAPETRPGRHPYHAAGLYYIQEPSAMSAAELLAAQPGELVLDLAAAPGGKATQILGRLAGRGLLVANEIHPARARVLSENIERMGFANAVVTSEPPDRLARRFPGFFDAVMLDAPCSGEGMFRKDPDAVREWSEAAVAACAARQADILDEAAKMVRTGGRLVYSTCTFNREENEETIARFLGRRPDFELVRTLRLWPHRERGEGHFAALLVRGDGGEGAEDASAPAGRRRASGKARSDRRDGPGAGGFARFRAFAAEALPGFRPEEELPAGEPLAFGQQLYWLPDGGGRFGPRLLDGLRVLRPGLHLGDLPKDRFEPAHALALHLRPSAARWTLGAAADAPETAAYLRGEALPADAGLSGWGLVCVDGLPLGWGKAAGGRVNNRLPKGLRRP
jgi:16S rRNA C967 or C1407 C5-methylase (RsmB/RsmF family)/NOL1/NOP2/fmu family ribosome biogenesis protein